MLEIARRIARDGCRAPRARRRAGAATASSPSPSSSRPRRPRSARARRARRRRQRARRRSARSSFNVHAVRVAVDPETGTVRVLQSVQAADAGLRDEPGAVPRADRGRRGTGHRQRALRRGADRRRRGGREPRLPPVPRAAVRRRPGHRGATSPTPHDRRPVRREVDERVALQPGRRRPIGNAIARALGARAVRAAVLARPGVAPCRRPTDAASVRRGIRPPPEARPERRVADPEHLVTPPKHRRRTRRNVRGHSVGRSASIRRGATPDGIDTATSRRGPAASRPLAAAFVSIRPRPRRRAHPGAPRPARAAAAKRRRRTARSASSTPGSRTRSSRASSTPTRTATTTRPASTRSSASPAPTPASPSCSPARSRSPSATPPRSAPRSPSRTRR